MINGNNRPYTPFGPDTAPNSTSNAETSTKVASRSTRETQRIARVFAEQIAVREIKPNVALPGLGTVVVTHALRAIPALVTLCPNAPILWAVIEKTDKSVTIESGTATDATITVYLG